MAKLRSRHKSQNSVEYEDIDGLKTDGKVYVDGPSAGWLGRFLLRILQGIIILYLTSPLIAFVIPGVTTQFIFLNIFGKRWFYNDLAYPDSMLYNLTGTRNLYLNSTDGVKLGTWQMLPISSHENAHNKDDSHYDNALADGKPIVVYFHGNSATRQILAGSKQVGCGVQLSAEYYESALGDGSPVVVYLHGNGAARGFPHRIQLYMVLSELDYHTVAIDYRGFADSTGWPYPEGMFADAIAAYDWVLARSNSAPIYIWGHSMGSGVASRVAKILCDKGSCPAGVILETPFNSLHDAFMNHPFTMPFWVMPGYSWLLAYAMDDTISQFNSENCMSSISCPLMILHAEDDFIVPFSLGQRLYKTAMESRSKKSKPAQFHNFGRNGYGHKYICNSPDLPGIIKQFIG